MNLSELKQRASQLGALAAGHGASQLRVFGSVARGEETASSDVDFLVHLNPDASILDLIALRQDLSDLLGVSVDVVSDDAISPYLEKRIRSEAISL